MLVEPGNQFSLTRAALSTCGRAKTKFLSVLTLVALVLGTLLPSGTAVAANSIAITETWTDSLVSEPDGSGGTFYYVSSQVGATLSASLAVPGLGVLPAEDWSYMDVGIYIGNLQFSENLSAANTLSSTRAVFNLTGYDDFGNDVPMGQITFSRSGDTLTISTAQLKLDIAAGYYYGMPGPIQDAVACNITAGDFMIERSVYLTGRNTITPRTAPDGEEFDLNAISISGSADFVPPTVTMLSPTSGAKLTNEIVTVRVRATDNIGVSDVQFSVNGEEFSSGEPDPIVINVWTMDLLLEPGTNTLQVISYDVDGNVSATNTSKVIYVVLAPIIVQTIGAGTVTTNYNNQLLAIGNNYTMTAKPATGFAFAGWSGSLETTNATLAFRMDWDLSFTAVFVDVARPTNTITSPTVNQFWSNAVFTVTGTARDNVEVTNLWYQLNSTGWIPGATTNGWTNWTAVVNLTPGTNTVEAYALDSVGNRSTTNRVSFVYVVSDTLRVQTNGKGTLTANYSGVMLEIAKSYSMTAKAATGFVFSNWVVSTNWTGGATNTSATLSFIMQSNLTLQVNFVDTNKPALAIIAPTANQRWSNAVFTVAGTASDNAQVGSVLYQLNGGAWTNALTTNAWTNWTAGMVLAPGTNIVRAYAVDTTGNKSLTNAASLQFVVTNQLLVSATGKGTLSVNYSNTWLEIGRNYSLKATPGSGFVFTNWVISTNWVGSATTNNATVQFMMQSNLTLQVNFVDTNRPVLAITSPTAGQKMTNALANVKGTASDNWRVASVQYQLNSGAWGLAMSTNGWTNWTVVLPLRAGTNVIKAYAVDLSGNASPTNTVSVTSSNTFNLSLGYSSAQPMTSDGLHLSLGVSPGISGRIEVSTNLEDWTTLSSFISTNATMQFRDSAATNLNRRFYRAVVP